MAVKKNPFRFIVYFFILLIIFLGAAFWYYQTLQSPLDPSGAMKAFVIRKGESTESVVNRLEDEGFIRSAIAFKIFLKLQGQDPHIEAGDFKISPAMTYGEVLKTLSSGSIDNWVTILEGWRVEEIARELNQELGVDEQEFIAKARGVEGYLFPDTYLINPDASVETIISLLRNNFNQKYDQSLQQKIKAQGLTPEEGVILASLVEREARSDKIRTEVAAIILKRLNIGMKLDIDATVQYAKDLAAVENGQAPKKFWQPVTRADYKEVDSQFNTYLNPGLPPAPISNPSLSSLQAVANADATTPYLYYYHDTQGNTYYATTLEEHNDNVARYR